MSSPFSKYYSATKHLLDVYDKTSRQMGFHAKSIEEYESWKQTLRDKFREISGMTKLEWCELSPETLESVDMGDHIREKVLLQTEPDVFMPVYVLIPKEQDPFKRCVIATHGHELGGKISIVGRYDIPFVDRQIARYNAAYGTELVKRGYTVFCPDARGHGERVEWPLQGAAGDDLFRCTCSHLNKMAIALGLSLGGMWAWDLIRLIDYIHTRTDVNPERLACVGLSGGGYQTLMVTALDDRIKCGVASGYFYGVRDALLKLSDNCDCNYIPNLWKYADMGDLGALIAPRPFLVESGTNDPLNGERGIENVKEQLDITRDAYKLYGAENKLLWSVFEGVHRWNGKDTYDFLNQNL